MKFSDFSYQRPDMTAMQEQFTALLTQFDNATSMQQQNDLMKQINKLRANFDTMWNIALIRYNIDTTNADYEAEQNYFDEQLPVFDGLKSQFYRSLVASKFKKELSELWGSQLFDIAEATIKTFSPEVLEDLKKENKLISSYTKLKASAKVEFNGETLNLAGMEPFMQSEDRAIRKAASAAKWQFYADNATEFDRIFDELVQVRHTIATKLGYANFVELGYNRMLRTDYDAKMVANFRKQVLEDIVPVAKELRQRQAKRLGVEDDFKYYDIKFNFKTGNPTPKGSPDWIVANGKVLYNELSPETDEFFNFMIDNELMDLVNKDGKAPGGFCTFIDNYKSPYIFSNFNGTSHDINVLTHEAGHAFQVYMSRDYEVPEYNWPTYEACEIHSMSMEFFAWPWMESFFKEDTEKFKFEHLSDSLLFLPYGVSVDEFQHFIYENPKATPAERNKAWRAIEKKYLPWVNYEGNEFLENGGYWQQQAHIYASPFYYIDYTLAQICAFQFWTKALDNQKEAFADYIELCKAGGSKPFLELVEYAKLTSPFEDGCIKSVMKPVEAFLDSVDDTAL